MSRIVLRSATIIALFVTIVAIENLPVSAKDLLQSLFKMRAPKAPADPAVEQLAEEMDWLENHIDNYGSVVPKQPDVWGQARLTKHRQEFEEEMYAQLNQFKVLLNGTVARSDETFLANAFALSTAISGGSLPAAVNPAAGELQTIPVPSVQQPVLPIGDSTPANGPEVKLDRFQFASPKIALEPTIVLDQHARYLNHLHELRRINEGDDTSDSPGYSLNLVRIPVSILPGKRTRRGYGAELTATITPKISDDLLPTTFRNLVINDLVDQLSLPITRIADQRVWESVERAAREREQLMSQIAQLSTQIKKLELEEKLAGESLAKIEVKLENLYEKVKAPLDLRDNLRTASIAEARSQIENAVIPEASRPVLIELEEQRRSAQSQQKVNKDRLIAARTRLVELEELKRQLEGLQAREAELLRVQQAAGTVVGPASRSRQARNPLPPSQVASVFGSDELIAVAKSFHEAYLGPNVRWNGGRKDTVHILDVQRYIQAELEGAFELLVRHPELWALVEASNCSPVGLATEIRAGHFNNVAMMRASFHLTLHQHEQRALLPERNLDKNSEEIPTPPSDAMVVVAAIPGEIKPVEALAWAVVVESALLNEQLLQDMGKVAIAKGCACMTGAHGMYLPDPPPEARAAFNEYVLCRWPIHVFALDPATQEQNIAEAFDRRRELQLALSLGFVTGQVSAQNLMRFSRDLQTRIETISLNKTATGFSHGPATFGWRFYPRLQPPQTPGTIRAFGQTILGGPSLDRDLLDRQIEPGMRECVAIVIMPSFVPYVTVDTHSNWFRLNHKDGWLPTRHNTEISTVDMVRLSRSIKAMQHLAGAALRPDFYRDGEIDRLSRRIDQLDDRLPLQTMLVQVPIENTLGGFEMFNNGVTDLAPELVGWYGAPGILVGAPSECPSCPAAEAGEQAQPYAVYGTPLPKVKDGDCATPGTTLFLVGNHFSVHDTKVIAGGKCIPNFVLLSRQVMRVTIPPDVNTVFIDDEGRRDEYADIHVATPYGVTSHLHVPVFRPAAATVAAAPALDLRWTTRTVIARVCYKASNGGVHSMEYVQPNAGSLPGTLLVNHSNPVLLHPRKAVAALKLVGVNSDGQRHEIGDPLYYKLEFDSRWNATINFAGDAADKILRLLSDNLIETARIARVDAEVLLNFEEPLNHPAASGLPILPTAGPALVIQLQPMPSAGVCASAVWPPVQPQGLVEPPSANESTLRFPLQTGHVNQGAARHR